MWFRTDKFESLVTDKEILHCANKIKGDTEEENDIRKHFPIKLNID